jgi:N-acyl-D-aspartate/D-glutamate deacylase
MPKLYDLAITGGKIIDGTGNPWFKADVAIKGERTARIGKVDPSTAKRTLDATGKVVSPGFIDVHSHSDFSLIFDPRAESTIRQGITTLVVGQCGMSLAPINRKFEKLLRRYAAPFLPDPNIKLPWTTFKQYLAKMQQLRSTSNAAHLVGHGTVRIAAMGFAEREPNRRELEHMKAMVAEAMKAGAVGMSTGLIYPPGMFSNTKELIELTKKVAKNGGTYFSHIRGEGLTLIKAVKEAIEIGEKAGTPVHISHHKAAGRRVWGKLKETLDWMEEARKRGVDVTYDQYPYIAGMTSLVTMLPPWVHEGGMDRLLERIRDNETWATIRREMEVGTPERENMLDEAGWERIVVSSVKSQTLKKVEGKNLAEITKLLGKPDEFTALRDLLLEDQGGATMIMFSMDEGDVEYAMKGRYHMVGTDAWSVSSTGPLSSGKPHPRFYGTYPRVLGQYVRNRHILELEDAIRRMTSLPAQRVGLRNRGMLREGFFADVVLFDPKKVIDKATFEQPAQFPEGIDTVVVNGQIVVDSGELTKARPGKILLKKN